MMQRKGTDRKSFVYGKSVGYRVDLGGRRINKKDRPANSFCDTKQKQNRYIHLNIKHIYRFKKAHLIQGSYFKTVYELFPSDNHHKPWLYDGWLFSNHHHLYPQKTS